jgi:enoyl-CoA hydratase
MPDVEIRVEGRAGRITLNRPQALNALTLPMVQAVRAALVEWAQDAAVALVVVDGTGGRALCAGGDIRVLYDAARAGEMDTPRAFFTEEYAMNGEIARFPKPYVALMDGMVIGGGVGISAHGSVRVVTERTALAMPETGIGLFPDVGATWLLSRDLSRGLHLALTGARIGAGDAIAAGLADHFIRYGKLRMLIEELRNCVGWEAVSSCIGWHREAPPPATIVGDWISACYTRPTMEAIVEALAANKDHRAQAAAVEIAGKSPSSCKVTLRALREAAGMGSLDEALGRELVLAMGCMKSHDFVEGVRAAVIDKDRAPVWLPARLEDVSEGDVAAYFS